MRQVVSHPHSLLALFLGLYLLLVCTLCFFHIFYLQFYSGGLHKFPSCGLFFASAHPMYLFNSCSYISSISQISVFIIQPGVRVMSFINICLCFQFVFRSFLGGFETFIGFPFLLCCCYCFLI